MKQIPLECPQLAKGYELTEDYFINLLPSFAPFFDIQRYIKRGTCLGQVLALGRAYLYAENKDNLDVDFFKNILVSNSHNILQFHAVAGWAWADAVGKPPVIINFSNTFPAKTSITDTPIDEVKTTRTQVVEPLSINIKNILHETPCVGLSFHPDTWALNGHIVFLYKENEDLILAYDSDSNDFYEGSPEEIDKLLKDMYGECPLASVSSFQKVIAYDKSLFFKEDRPAVVPSLMAQNSASSSSSSSQP